MSQVKRIASAITHDKTIELLTGLDIHTITNDNGTEFSLWHLTEQELNISIFFNRPYSSWERGANKNTNGLVRQYFPKATDFIKTDEKDIALVERVLNTRPRKCLGFKTPVEFYNEYSPNKIDVKELSSAELERVACLLSCR